MISFEPRVDHAFGVEVQVSPLELILVELILPRLDLKIAVRT
jgi:hypothetical protein